MSYRDTRNFIEMMRALGYHELISIEDFRHTNFQLVSKLLIWLIKRFDPDCNLLYDIDNEEGRIKLIKNAAHIMALKANIKLNTKKLYQADGYALKELLKLTSVLYEALNVDINENDDNLDNENLNIRNFELSDKLNELKLSRQLASEVTTTGATLYDLLGKEPDLKLARQKSLAKQFELNDIEIGIRKTIDTITKEIDETKQLIEGVATTESNLDAKIERRKVEIDRYEKRLQTLKKVRPAFLEEFTILEGELEKLFIQYSIRQRLLNYLENLYKEQEKIWHENQMMVVAPKIETIPLEDDTLIEEPKQERPRASTGTRRVGTSKVYTGVQSELLATPSSSESETDLFIDKDESELLNSDDEESLGLDIDRDTKIVGAVGRVGTTTTNKIQQDNSDDDF